MTEESTPSDTPAGLLRRINKLSTAIVITQAAQSATPSREQAVELQGLQGRRAVLQKLLPALRVVG